MADIPTFMRTFSASTACISSDSSGCQVRPPLVSTPPAGRRAARETTRIAKERFRGCHHRQVVAPAASTAAARSLCRRRAGCVAAESVNASVTAQTATEVLADRSVSVVLLAGGVGKRMGASMPKQYLPLLGRPIALHSFLTFANMAEVGEIVIVCNPDYRGIFLDVAANKTGAEAPGLRFALPGKERQDSVFNGLQEVRPGAALVAVHDSARPLITASDTRKCLLDAVQYGAAVLGVRSKATIKEADESGFVVRTLDRRFLWEMQTPQVMRPQLLRDGFELVQREGLEVTDDVSIVEHLRHPVRITEGSYANIKVTTPEDLLVAEKLLLEEAAAAEVAAAAAAR